MSLKIYKRGQGYYTRLFTGLVVFAIVAMGSFVLYNKLQVWDISIWAQTLIPAGVCIVLSLLVFWLVNKPNIADFMISAEGEIKKVSWSSRQEIMASTVIVIIVVTAMAMLLMFADLAFRAGLGRLGLYPAS